MLACCRDRIVARIASSGTDVLAVVSGAGYAVFEEAGEHALEGVPDRWHLFKVVA